MSGTGVLLNGKPLVEEYGLDLDQLGEGDRVGVMRTSSGDLQFFINGRSQGVAATRVPPRLFVVVDLYGKCAQISIVDGAADSGERACHASVHSLLNLPGVFVSPSLVVCIVDDPCTIASRRQVLRGRQ